MLFARERKPRLCPLRSERWCNVGLWSLSIIGNALLMKSILADDLLDC